MLQLSIVVFGAVAAWLLAPGIVAPFATRVATVPEAPLIERLGRRFFGSINRRGSMRGYVSDLDTKLRLAGDRSLTGERFLEQAQGIGLLAAAGALLLFSAAFGPGIGVSVASIVLGAATTWLMLALIDNRIAERRRQLGRQFPYFLDIAVMTMDSGTGMLEVIDTYTRSAPQAAMAQELAAVTTDIRMGTTVDAALSAMESRIPAADVIGVSRAIRQGMRMGTPLAQVFREQADTMRFKRSQTAERSAEELKVKLQGPTMMLVVAVLVLVLGPALVGMAQGGF